MLVRGNVLRRLDSLRADRRLLLEHVQDIMFYLLPPTRHPN